MAQEKKIPFDSEQRYQDSVYTGPDLFRTSTKLVWIILVFTWDLVDRVRDGSAIWRILSGTNGSTYEGDPIWNRTVPVSNQPRVNRVDRYRS